MQQKGPLPHLITFCICLFVSIGWPTLYERVNGDLKVGRGTHLEMCKKENDHCGTSSAAGSAVDVGANINGAGGDLEDCADNPGAFMMAQAGGKPTQVPKKRKRKRNSGD